MEVLTRFTSALWTPDDRLELRAIHPAKDRGALSIWTTAAEIEKCVEWGNKRNLDGFGIYVGANPRKDLGKSAADVALARCLFVDFDGVDVGTATALVADRCLPLPTAVVASGHGCHCWWRLVEPMTDLAEWSGRQRALIALLGSDRAIHDPPRVMRLPGWWNTKEPRAVVELVDCDGSRVYGLGQFPEADAGLRRPTQAYTGLNGTAANLSRATLLFVAAGAPEGERNARLFSAACDFAGNGLDEGTAEARLLPVAASCGLAEAEARQTIRSAYSKPRAAARPPKDEPVDEQDWSGSDGGAGWHDGQSPEVTAQTRSHFGNVRVEGKEIKGKDGITKQVEVVTYRQLDDIGRALRHLTGGWPKTIGGLPFVIRKGNAGPRISTLPRTADLFAWIGERVRPYWSEKSCYSDEGGKCSPPTKDEFYAYIKASGDAYSTASNLPHEPPVPGVYYLDCDLPAVDIDTEGTPALDEFCAMLNPETEDDRALMRAAVLTLFWGGPCGGRPAFVFCSEHGRGSGKTSTAEAIAALAGGHFSVGPKEEWAQASKRLVSDRAMQCRAILIDNVRGRLGGQEIESLITAKIIEGWRAYHGDFSRPNLSTLFITSNVPTLSQDLATRTVLVKIGKQKHDQSFLTWASEFQDKKGSRVAAECLAVLAAPPVGQISKRNRDRWQAWQDGVLCRLPNADALAALVVSRREGVDADAEEAGNVAKAIVDWLRSRGLDPGVNTHRITRDEMRDLLIKAKVIDDGMNKRGLHTWISGMLGSDGELPALRDDPNKEGGRCWKWVGALWTPNNDDLPPV